MAYNLRLPDLKLIAVQAGLRYLEWQNTNRSNTVYHEAEGNPAIRPEYETTDFRQCVQRVKYGWYCAWYNQFYDNIWPPKEFLSCIQLAIWRLHTFLLTM